jgi:hypothetical protein
LLYVRGTNAAQYFEGEVEICVWCEDTVWSCIVM